MAKNLPERTFQTGVSGLGPQNLVAAAILWTVKRALDFTLLAPDLRYDVKLMEILVLPTAFVGFYFSVRAAKGWC